MAGWNLYIAGGWLIAAAGLALVLLFAFGRRVLARRTPRCVACGYRLEGMPAAHGILPCPECGRIPRGPAEPYALGRKRWIGVLGVVLIAGGWALAAVPIVRAHGWATLLPIGTQVRLLDFSDDPDLWYRVATRASQGRAATTMERPLRRCVLGRLLDPGADPLPAIRAMSILGMRSNLSAPMLTQEDLTRVLAEGAPRARAYAMEQLGRVPPSPELAALRRVAWADAPAAQRKILFDWLLRHPADTEDLGLIRAALLNADFSIAMTVGRELSKSPSEVAQTILELFKHEDPRVRTYAVLCFEHWMRDRDGKPPVEIQRSILAMLDDADPGVREWVGRMVPGMSEELAEPIGELLLGTSDPHRLMLLIKGIVGKDDPGLVPYLERAALQADRPLSHRLLLAETHAQARSRTRQAVGPPILEPIYREALERLAAGDPDILIVLASDLPWGPRPLLLLAIADAAAADGVQAQDLDAWFSDRPPVAALLKAAAPEAQSHAGAFAAVVASVSARDADPETIARLHAHHVRWFSKTPEPAQE